MFQFISHSLKFDQKTANVLKENADKILNICIANESNKHLRLQSLNGIYYLLQFEKLVEQYASKLDNQTEQNNLQFLANLVWNSLWNNFNNASVNVDATLQEEER